MRIYKSGKNRSIAEIMDIGIMDIGIEDSSLRRELVERHNRADLFPFDQYCGWPNSLRSDCPAGEKGSQTHVVNPHSLDSMSW
jgi:hypothetical protein